MALSNLEGSTIGGLDEGRGHNARILAFQGRVTLAGAITGSDTVVHSVDMDGNVTDTDSGSATHSLAVDFGHGLTLETPGIVDNDEVTFKLTFGEVSTTAVTASSENLDIKFAQVCIGVANAGGTSDFLPVPAAIKSVSGNQVQFSMGEITVNGANTAIVVSDVIHISVMAIAMPA
tara:strand:+ start:1421 stop:1948 length:528 start_codon:yes stop_codon:yes gene_type:complete